jgi:pimeloyl-ACP methyl ester carboxylesterase
MVFSTGPVLSQDSSRSKPGNTGDWPEECKLIYIPSKVDGTLQPAYFYRVPSSEPRPLVVSLHSWSAGYEQRDTLSWMCIAENYHYIHPDFRGKNNKPEACGSHLAIQDIDDAISYALANAPVSEKEVHVIGVSGGGHATLLSYMKSRHEIRSFSAWVPISDIEAWFYQSLSREPGYALDIVLATAGTDSLTGNLYFDKVEARRRSPIYMSTPVSRRQNSKLLIHAGIHDGYTGPIPISQSLLFYNKVVQDFDSTATQSLVPDKDIITLLANRLIPSENYPEIAGREIHYWKNYRNNIFVLIFEGSHEMLPEVVLNPVRSPGTYGQNE